MYRIQISEVVLKLMSFQTHGKYSTIYVELDYTPLLARGSVSIQVGGITQQ